MSSPTMPSGPPAGQTTAGGQTAKTRNKITGWRARNVRLSILWIFVTLNYIYCDVVTVMDPTHHAPFQLTEGFLLGASILVEIPIALVLLSFLLPYGPNRWANVIAGTIMTVVQVASLVVAVPTLYYAFFSAIEIASTACIVGYAWTWPRPDRNEQ